MLTTLGYQQAPVAVVVFVACLPVLVLGAGATLHHLLGDPLDHPAEQGTAQGAQAAEASTAPEIAQPTAQPAAGQEGRPVKPRRPVRRKPKQSAPRRLEADYLADARAALTPEVEPTAAWCQQVTTCGKTMAFRLAKTLRAEREQADQVTDLPTRNTTKNTEEEEAA